MSSRTQMRDGRSVLVREVEPDDEAAIGTFLDGLSLTSRRMRFFSAAADLRAAAAWAASSDGEDHLGLVALLNGDVVAHAAYVRTEVPRQAEVAVEVADELHHLGLGTVLIRLLAQTAERHGIESFVAEVLPENRAMLDVFEDGFEPTERVTRDAVLVEFPTAHWRAAERLRRACGLRQTRSPSASFS